jgi:uncharacterized protein (TIGR02145 family)
MKKILIFPMVMLITFNLFSQSPQKMSYQSVVRNSAGALVANQLIGIKISILQGSASGTVVYTETQTPTTNTNGLISIEIGGGAGFDAINWASGLYFLKTETDPAGGTNYTINGTSQLLSVPYALHATTSETSDDAVKKTGNQTIAGNKTFSGTTTVTTPVNSTDAATKAYVDNALKELGLIPVNYSGLLSDIDGNTYKTVTIGTQTWMAENLRVVRYKDGTAIPLVTDTIEWANLTTPGYCWYNNDEDNYKVAFGALYNWYAASAGNLCPEGWHVPTNDEWITLATFLGGTGNDGGKLKESGTAHWSSPNTGATNETGFSALPAGFRYLNGVFDTFGQVGYWWSATEYNASWAYYCRLHHDNTSFGSPYYVKVDGFSVRCLKDQDEP